jgi:hypothetical protein
MSVGETLTCRIPMLYYLRYFIVQLFYHYTKNAVSADSVSMNTISIVYALVREEQVRSN